MLLSRAKRLSPVPVFFLRLRLYRDDAFDISVVYLLKLITL